MRAISYPDSIGSDAQPRDVASASGQGGLPAYKRRPIASVRVCGCPPTTRSWGSKK